MASVSQTRIVAKQRLPDSSAMGKDRHGFFRPSVERPCGRLEWAVRYGTVQYNTPGKDVNPFMELEQAFLQSIRQRPGSLANRLVYADWLIEQGNPRGEFIHCQIRPPSAARQSAPPGPGGSGP